ncbi:hypothetical protein BOTBODRAFT_181095 [Botryobasidium botryosum FD-172 SS1]|uniref:F-box domain-containing protein n=1 Tax=Botryobasidium botryosum (strain FD-172 SS1) TaxID=930990 RepID=A0A067M5U9_BOTB1|nr:hypothetical protein BOTBODRAFT_181095 [Botryobasidium botryosum FD-172 SS1]
MTACIPAFSSFGLAITNFVFDIRHLFGVRLRDVFRVLQSCPNLVRCSVRGAGARTDRTGHADTVRLQRLEELEISHFTAMVDSLDRLEFPSLQSLSLTETSWGSQTIRSLYRSLQTCGKLSSIVLRDEQGRHYDGSPGFHDSLIVLNSVRRVTIHGNLVLCDLLEAISFPRLEELTLHSTLPDIVYNYMSLSTELREVSLYGIYDGTPMFLANDVPFLLPSLIRLHLENSNGVLDFISAPRLESLSLKGGARNLAPLGASLRQFLGQSQPPLRTLVFDGVDVGDEEMIWCLGQLPRLGELQVRKCTITDATLQALASPSPAVAGASWLLPKLTRIVLIRNRITPQSVIALLTSRNADPPAPAVGARLPSVDAELSFDPDRRPEERDIEVIASLGGLLR